MNSHKRCGVSLLPCLSCLLIVLSHLLLLRFLQLSSHNFQPSINMKRRFSDFSAKPAPKQAANAELDAWQCHGLLVGENRSGEHVFATVSEIGNVLYWNKGRMARLDNIIFLEGVNMDVVKVQLTENYETIRVSTLPTCSPMTYLTRSLGYLRSGPYQLHGYDQGRRS